MTRSLCMALSSIVLMAGGLLTVAPAAAAAITVRYPDGPGDCASPHTLQECIDSVDAGSTVIITSQVIDGGMSASINKSLTLRASSRSLKPELRGVSVYISTGTAKVTVQDLRFQTLAQVRLMGGSGHEVVLRRLEVGKGSTNSRGMEVTSRVRSSITIQDSYLRSTDHQDEALSLVAEASSGTVDFRVVGNRITGRGNPDSGAGVRLDMLGQGSVRAGIYSNVIWDVSRCYCGAASGVAILPDGAVHASVDIVGNTIERSMTNAIQQRNHMTGDGRLSLDVFDNIFSHHPNGALSLERGAPDSVRLRAGYNAYYGNGPDGLSGLSKGSHNQSAHPRFVDRAGGDLRLRADSKLIDKGLVCTPGGVAGRDASSRFRVTGSSVDLGAYERGAPSATGVVRLGTSGRDVLRGTSGRDILCGYGGDDTLCARDGKGGDWVDGGPGRDRARSDRGDHRRSIEATAPVSAC